MSLRLDEAVGSVPAEPFPADDSHDDLPADDLESGTGAAGDSGDDAGEPEGSGGKRTIENVRGELLRKLEKQNQELVAELRAIREEARKNYGVPDRQPAGPKTFDEMSVRELEALSSSIPAEQRPVFDQYLQERKLDEKLEQRLRDHTQKTEHETATKRFTATAVDRWPQLRDKNSELYRATDRILTAMGEAAARNPRAVLDAANEAGLDLGLSPATGAPRSAPMRTPGNVAPGRSTGPSPRRKDDPAIDPAKNQAIAARLSEAMPGRKFTDEQMKRIAKRQKAYQGVLHTYIKG